MAIMLGSFKVRQGCPVCGDTGSSIVCRMGREYLESSEKGWRFDPEKQRMAGLYFEQDPDAALSYHECTGCGTFYLREVAPWEEVSALRPPETSVNFYTSPPNRWIRDKIRYHHSLGQLMQVSLSSTGSDDPSVLDYGFGGGFHLAALRGMGIRNVVGYNVYDYTFERVRRYLDPGITLVSDPDELAKHAPFDAIHCNAVLEHVEEPNSVLEHIRQQLKPNGVVKIQAPSASRAEMRGYARDVERGQRVKLLHPGHLQLWNRDTLPLSTYVERAGFRITPIDLDVPMPDVMRAKGLLRLIAIHGKRIMTTAFAVAALKTGRFRGDSFFATKIA